MDPVISEKIPVLFMLATGVSIVIFLLEFKYLSPLLSPRISSTYSRLSPVTRIQWDRMIIWILHCELVQILVALYGVFMDNPMHEDVVWGTSVFVKIFCGDVSGHMIADAMLMYFYPGALYSAELLLHHVIVMTGTISIGCGAPFAYFMFIHALTSLSDPFKRICWFLTTAGYEKRSRIYVGNAVLYTTVFFLCRIAAIPVYLYLFIPTYLQLDKTLIFTILSVASVLFNLLNIYWFIKLFHGLIKLLRNYQENKVKNY